MQYISHFSYYCIDVGRAVRLYIIVDEEVFLYRIFRVGSILYAIFSKYMWPGQQKPTPKFDYVFKFLYHNFILSYTITK